MKRIEPGVAGTASAPVVAHLEHVHPADPRLQYLFGREPRVAREERLEGAVFHQEDHRVLVDVLTPPGPHRLGVEHGEAHPVEGEALAPADRVP